MITAIGVGLIVIGMNVVDYSHVDMLRHPGQPFSDKKRSRLVKTGLALIFSGLGCCAYKFFY